MLAGFQGHLQQKQHQKHQRQLLQAPHQLQGQGQPDQEHFDDAEKVQMHQQLYSRRIHFDEQMMMMALIVGQLAWVHFVADEAAMRKQLLNPVQTLGLGNPLLQLQSAWPRRWPCCLPAVNLWRRHLHLHALACAGHPLAQKALLHCGLHERLQLILAHSAEHCPVVLPAQFVIQQHCHGLMLCCANCLVLWMALVGMVPPGGQPNAAGPARHRHQK